MLPILPIIQKEAWVQCENPNCGKWRKLPLGTQVDENEAWYCYMNPDCARNTCSASEVVSYRLERNAHVYKWFKKLGYVDG